jgi:LPXTG-site transpeptidase (sortase) family protein
VAFYFAGVYMRQRSILLSVTAVLLTFAVYFGLNAAKYHQIEKPIVHSQVVASPTPKSVAPKTTVTPTPTPTPTATVSTTTKTTTTTKATAVAGNSLTISSIGVNAPIVDVGITTSKNIAAPSSNSQVGRWNGGGWPGALGSAVFLTGHVKGVFANLKNVTVGQTISVKYNNQTFNYRVVFKETVNLSGINMSKPLSIYGGGQEGLNMMTCAGTYSVFTGTYNQRLTVYTVRI